MDKLPADTGMPLPASTFPVPVDVRRHPYWTGERRNRRVKKADRIEINVTHARLQAGVPPSSVSILSAWRRSSRSIPTSISSSSKIRPSVTPGSARVADARPMTAAPAWMEPACGARRMPLAPTATSAPAAPRAGRPFLFGVAA